MIKKMMPEFQGKPIAIWLFPSQWKEKEKWANIIGFKNHIGSEYWTADESDDRNALIKRLVTFFKENCVCNLKAHIFSNGKSKTANFFFDFLIGFSKLYSIDICFELLDAFRIK
jgi:hypothetical protein